MRKAVLIFDDDMDLLNICELILKQKNLDIVTQQHCNNLLESIAIHKPGVIIMDYRIPDMGGVKAIQLIKQSVYSAIPVILFSGNHDLEELAKEAGADFHLNKPFDITVFEEMVEQAMRKNS
jgi:DNA-binding NtrC family response regulator